MDFSFKNENDEYDDFPNISLKEGSYINSNIFENQHYNVLNNVNNSEISKETSIINPFFKKQPEEYNNIENVKKVKEAKLNEELNKDYYNLIKKKNNNFINVNIKKFEFKNKQNNLNNLNLNFINFLKNNENLNKKYLQKVNSNLDLIKNENIEFIKNEEIIDLKERINILNNLKWNKKLWNKRIKYLKNKKNLMKNNKFCLNIYNDNIFIYL